MSMCLIKRSITRLQKEEGLVKECPSGLNRFEAQAQLPTILYGLALVSELASNCRSTRATSPFPNQLVSLKLKFHDILLEDMKVSYII